MQVFDTSWLRKPTLLYAATAASVFALSYAYFTQDKAEHVNAAIEESNVQRSQPAQTTPEIHTRRTLSELYSATKEHTFSLKSRKGDTLAELILQTGAGNSQATDILASVKPVYNPKNLAVGQELKAVGTFNDNGEFGIQALTFRPAATKEITVSRRKDGSFETKAVDIPLRKELFFASAKIKDSLFETAVKMGVPVSKMANLVNAYSYDVDFQRQIKAGDGFEVIIERFYDDRGNFTHYGNVMYSSLTLRDEAYNLYHYTYADGSDGYFNENGESVKKALLRTPMNAARMTSGFGMRRHPVMGYSRMHRGVDFAAPTGTPIFAAGDGVVAFAGRKGGYGNYLKLSHGNSYETAYGHVSAFGAGVRNGTRVKQGQVVAYVGSTGMSTGPHLHFEVLVNGEQVDPTKVKFSAGQKLAGKDLAAFKDRQQHIRGYIASIGSGNKVASAR